MVKKMKFWQIAYIVTLLPFVFCMYAGLLSLAVYTFSEQVDNRVESCRAEFEYLARNFELDSRSPLEFGEGTLSYVMEAYGAYGKNDRLYFIFQKNGETVYCSLPDGSDLIAKWEEFQRIDGDRYVILKTDLSAEWAKEYRMYYIRYAGDLDDAFQSLILLYIGVATLVSASLAAVLLFLIKKLTKPLEELEKASDRIAAGDLTSRVKAQGTVETVSLAGSFNAMADTVGAQMRELEQNAERKQMLVNNMAHELRTPLTSIMGYAEYIGRASLNEEERIDACMRIMSEAERLKKISEKLLDKAYIEHNEIKKEEVDISALLRDTAERLKQKANEKSVTITVEASECTVSGDETLLSVLFYNLTENAIKACGKDGRVTLSCEGSGACVSDDGKGMTPEQLTHITEPFYRIDKSRSRAEGGAGLGLTLCRTIAEQHGFGLDFSSQPGKGTKITLTF
ncbi:MAG: HAMP domain-containing histidine kinase [Clostridia bacterium]|nr:HAMP domain-containing histidine kinase [Clostridia bacterium]